VRRPDVDGRLAEKLRQIATSQTDSWVSAGGVSGLLSGDEKARILNIAADVFEEYILAHRHPAYSGERLMSAHTPFPASALDGVERLVAPHVKSAADRIYEDVMLTVQDYLRDNVEYNIAQQIATAEREATYAYGRLREMTDHRDAIRDAAWALLRRFPADQHDDSPLKDEADALRAAISLATGETPR